MRVAPSFSLTLHHGRRERMLVAAWCGLAMAAPAAWLVVMVWPSLWPSAAPGWIQGLVALAVGSLSAAWAWRVPSQESVTLDWHEGVWRLGLPGRSSSTSHGALEPMLDFGDWMLLRFRGAESKAQRWLSVDRTRAGRHWHALRAGLYCPAQAPSQAGLA